MRPRRSVIVSESLARMLWPGRAPLGERARIGDTEVTVAAVVRDVQSASSGLAERTVYRSAETMRAGDAFYVAFDGGATQTAQAICDTITTLDADAAAAPQTLGSIRRDAAAKFMPIVELVLGLGIVALALGVAGIYGVVAFTVGRRMRRWVFASRWAPTAWTLSAWCCRPGAAAIGVGLAAGVGFASRARTLSTSSETRRSESMRGTRSSTPPSSSCSPSPQWSRCSVRRRARRRGSRARCGAEWKDRPLELVRISAMVLIESRILRSLRYAVPPDFETVHEGRPPEHEFVGAGVQVAVKSCARPIVDHAGKGIKEPKGTRAPRQGSRGPKETGFQAVQRLLFITLRRQRKSLGDQRSTVERRLLHHRDGCLVNIFATEYSASDASGRSWREWPLSTRRFADLWSVSSRRPPGCCLLDGSPYL